MISIRDVAREAGVSATTVSLVLNGRAEELRISKRSADLVQATAKRLGYQGNYHARMLASQSTFTIGLAYDLEQLPPRWSAAFQRGVTRAAAQRRFSILHVGLVQDEPVSKQLRVQLYQARVDGMLVLQAAPEEWLEDRQGHVYPVVGILPTGSTMPVQVTIKEEPGIEAALKDLHAKGHRKVLYLDSRVGRGSFSKGRLDAYRKLSQKIGLKLETVAVEGQNGVIESAGELIQFYHQKIREAKVRIPRGTRAVVCANDYHAMALAFYLREIGFRVPEDVSLIGFDDTVSDIHVPPLHTVTFSREEMGEVAVETMFELLAQRPLKRSRCKVLRVPSRYLERGSVSAKSG